MRDRSRSEDGLVLGRRAVDVFDAERGPVGQLDGQIDVTRFEGIQHVHRVAERLAGEAAAQPQVAEGQADQIATERPAGAAGPVAQANECDLDPGKVAGTWELYISNRAGRFIYLFINILTKRFIPNREIDKKKIKKKF